MPRKPTDDQDRVCAVVDELVEEAAHEAAADAALAPSDEAEALAAHWRRHLTAEVAPVLAAGSTDGTAPPGDASSVRIPAAWRAHEARIEARARASGALPSDGESRDDEEA